MNRKSPRIPHFDYATPNWYFITICTHEKKCIFGKPDELNHYGTIAEDCLGHIAKVYPTVRINKYVVMPNHVHVLLIVEDSNTISVSQIIGQYKMAVTKQIHNVNANIIVWQRSFHDHIIRTRKQYEIIWNYIENNPLKWNLDCFYCEE